MSGSSPTSSGQFQVLYEIALSIGRGETLSAVAQTALSSYLRRLNCSTGGVFERYEEDGDVSYRLIEGIPAAPTYNDTFEAATRHLDHDDATDAASFREELPLSADDGAARYYIFDLPGFGVLVMIKNGEPFAPGTIAALDPLNQKLADACCNRRVEQEAAQTRETLRAVLDTIPQEVFVKDRHGRYTLANESAAAVYGVRVGELEGSTDEEYARSGDRDVPATDMNVIESGDPRRIEDEELIDADGRTRTVTTDIVPLELPETERQALVVTTDTTDLRETRKQLRRSNEELEQFAYAASHDLKEPLRSVSNYLTLLDDLYDEGQTFDAQAETLIEDAVGATGRMQSMINALLQYSRVDSRGGALEPTSLDAVVEKAELNLTVRIDDIGATATTEALPTVSGDERLLIQLFQNLIDNGLKYNESANPRISITPGEPVANIDPPEPVALDADTSWHHIRVEDNGIGMDADVADRAFDVFERLGRTDENGTGMGLTLCQRIVEYHNGAVWLESAPGDGTAVHVCLPDG